MLRSSRELHFDPFPASCSVARQQERGQLRVDQGLYWLVDRQYSEAHLLSLSFRVSQLEELDQVVATPAATVSVETAAEDEEEDAEEAPAEPEDEV